MSYFDAAFAVIIGAEGGYVFDPRDPGGETMWGISKRSYPNVDIKQLTLVEAKLIFRRDFWDALKLDTLSWELALCLFDAAVNQGQNYARTLPHDATDLMALRAERYAANSNFDTYGRGWMHRLFTVFRNAQRTPT